MERRPAPEVTIAGGTGWQLAEAGQDDLIGADVAESAPRRAWWQGHRPWALVLAAAVGFLAATALADVRVRTIAESPEGVLSLDLQSDGFGSSASLVSADDGSLAVTTSLVLRNTGPQPVALEQAELLGTAYRSDDLAGRRVGAGGQTMVVLLHRVDCDALEVTGTSGLMRVQATTGAGRRSVDLRIPGEALPFHDELARGACGQADPDTAFAARELTPRVDGGTAVVSASLSNASARRLQVHELRPAAGLRIVRVHDGAGATLTLPISLEPGDYDPPVQPFDGRGPDRTVVVVLEVEDCAQLNVEDELPPLVQARVGATATQVSDTAWGYDQTVLFRLRRASCPAPASG